MKKKILMLHGNGGAASRFQLIVEDWAKKSSDIEVVIPRLSGFEGRPIDEPVKWDTFIDDLKKEVQKDMDAIWIFYGHGIGGSILLEWARKDWTLADSLNANPQLVILNGPIGASLEHRFFPKLMKPKIMRNIMHWLIYQKWLQPIWEKRLFLVPENIPIPIRNQFFADYASCKAFPHFFDLITPSWYKGLVPDLKDKSFYFLWGKKERVVASKFLDLWRKDFPYSKFEIVDEWDHFPMLDDPPSFQDKILQIIEQEIPAES
ncbi:MAG: alpha/beta hydrolase [Bacteroidota bacterium]